MPDFTLNTSTLAGGNYVTRAIDLGGEFREISFRFGQTAASQDMEIHFIEFHFELGGVSMEPI